MQFKLALLALVPSVIAHYQLQYPTAIGPFVDDTEPESPCGGYAIPSPLVGAANSTNATVDSFAVSLKTGHPQSQWLFRATVSTQAPYNWTNLLPVVQQTSVGQFCLPNLKAPADFAGKTGVVQIIGSATDGYLYQCAIVNFVTGSNTTVGAQCTNATGLTATITNQQNFTSGNSSDATTTSAAPSATSSHSAADALMHDTGFLGAAFAVIGVVFML